MRLLSKKEIGDAQGLSYLDVPLPRWGKDAGIRVRSMMVGEVDEWKELFGDKTAHAHERIAVRFLVDADGVQLYKDGDWEVFRGKDRDSMELILDAVLKVNGMTKAVQEAMEKNSKSPADEGSSSPSPGISESPSHG